MLQICTLHGYAHNAPLTVVHEGLHCPQLCANDKAADVAGNVAVQDELREFHFVLHLLKLGEGELLKVNRPQHHEETGRLVLGNKDCGHTIAAHTWSERKSTLTSIHQ